MKSESAPQHLVIRAPNWVGDLVMSTPVLKAALADERFGRISILVRSHLLPILRDERWEPHLVPIEGGQDEVALLRGLAPDVALVLSSSFGAAWRVWRAGIPVRAGSALSGRRWLLTHAALPPVRDGRRYPAPTAYQLRDVAGLLGLEVTNIEPQLAVRREVRERQSALLSEAGVRRDEGYVLCCPGAAFGAAKLWPPESFARALDLVHRDHGLRAVVAGGPNERALIEAVARATRHGALSLAGRPSDLEGLKALVVGARLLLVGDSGPRWLAAAFRVPCVSVLGPTFPELTSSSLELCEIVRVEGLECSPCQGRVCYLGHHRCMRELAPSAVAAAATRVLERARDVALSGVPG